jgi:hypothetical protein
MRDVAVYSAAIEQRLLDGEFYTGGATTALCAQRGECIGIA